MAIRVCTPTHQSNCSAGSSENAMTSFASKPCSCGSATYRAFNTARRRRLPGMTGFGEAQGEAPPHFRTAAMRLTIIVKAAQFKIRNAQRFEWTQPRTGVRPVQAHGCHTHRAFAANRGRKTPTEQYTLTQRKSADAGGALFSRGEIGLHRTLAAPRRPDATRQISEKK